MKYKQAARAKERSRETQFGADIFVGPKAVTKLRWLSRPQMESHDIKDH